MKNEYLVFVFMMCASLLFCVSSNPLNAIKKSKTLEPTAASATNTKDGEWNRKCKTITDCGSFGYICAKNKTCQCAKHYIVDYKIKLCLGGVEQKCQYDEHCIKNAYCMNQEFCQCKEKWPIESNDGLECSNKSTKNQLSIILQISMIFLVRI